MVFIICGGLAVIALTGIGLTFLGIATKKIHV